MGLADGLQANPLGQVRGCTRLSATLPSEVPPPPEPIMSTNRRQFLSAAAISPILSQLAIAEEMPTDTRLAKPKNLDGYFPFTVPPTPEAWAKRRHDVREQVLVSQGLWPLPERTPLNAVIHGKIERNGYTVEKVYFQSRPGHTVCGNLYRPTGSTGKRPAVLFAHGHWAGGRFEAANEKTAKQAVEKGWEPDVTRGQFFMQALPVGLVRRGFVVFQYDMIGYADSTTLDHRTGFGDAAAELRLLSPMGLQTWNSIRSLDFLTGLADVDASKIGVTGASGGGTQTFMLCAVDDRPAAAVPAVMVSTAMQGGCVCENASHLRVGTGNIELAALMAPKPLALTCADDWTKEMDKKGFPELKRLYTLLGAAGKLAMMYKPHPHNYNVHARQFMTAFFSKHLLGKEEPTPEAIFEPIPTKQLSVFDDKHPRPADLQVAKLRDAMAADADKQLDALPPAEFRKVVGTALRVLVHDQLPPPEPGLVSVNGFESKKGPNDVSIHTAILGRGEGQAIKTVGLVPPGFEQRVVIWADPRGTAALYEKDGYAPAVAALLNKRFAVFGLDLFQSPNSLNAAKPSSNQTSGAFFFGYNRGVMAERVRDMLTGIANLRDNARCEDIRVCGWGWAGPVALLAAALAGPVVKRVATDANGFRFESITELTDPMLLPGAVKYGGLPGFATLVAPTPLLLHNHRGTGSGKRLPAAYAAMNAEAKLVRSPEALTPLKVAEWLAS